MRATLTFSSIVKASRIGRKMHVDPLRISRGGWTWREFALRWQIRQKQRDHETSAMLWQVDTSGNGDRHNTRCAALIG